MKQAKALLDVEELDTQTLSVPLTIDGILSSVDAASQGLANKTVRPDPTDRASLLAYATYAEQAARLLTSAAGRLHEQAALLRAAGLVAYHRAPSPKRRARRR